MQSYCCSVDFLRVELQASRGRLADLEDFYANQLGMERAAGGFRIGVSELVFRGAEGEPFYHYALLAPGDRFSAALIWARDRIDLLLGGDIDEVVFDFDNWNAHAFYFHDPAGNIVELIAHRALGETGKTGAFDASELLGISEVGLVGDPGEIAISLEQLDLRLWDGALLPGRLAFFGERGRTFIVAAEERGWLPTGRAAEGHPVDVVVTGPAEGEVTASGHRIRRVDLSDDSAP